MEELTTPRAFISYSWSSPAHEAWVLDLATQLRAAGVDAVLDKWDLKEGHDAVAFMEQMASDPTIGKVILVFDKTYVEKTESRKGGVGTEAQIISAKIYSGQDKDKFAAVVRELDSDGIPYTPTYYKSRIHIDMSDDESFAERFEQLVRWLFDKPLQQRPPVGKPPAYLTSRSASTSSTEQRRAVTSLKMARSSARADVLDYFDHLAAEIRGLTLDPSLNPFDDAVVESIGAFQPQRNEYIEFVQTLARSEREGIADDLHRGFETLLPLMYRPEDVHHYRESDWDNLRFIVHELFLYTVGTLIQHERFSETGILLQSDFYFERGANFGVGKLVGFGAFFERLQSLEARSHRLASGGSRRSSIHADLLKERSTGVPLSFTSLMQADFTLYLSAQVGEVTRWWPVTLLYADRDGAFEIFARSRSMSYFSRLAPLFGGISAEQFKAKIVALAESQQVPTFNSWRHLDVATLAGLETLGTRP